MTERRSYSSFAEKTLERIASDLRAKHGKFDGKRLLVEYLVDKLGFELIPREGLREELGIDAYLPKRPNTIIVDRDEMDFGSPRYNFTLTHEIAHSIIHLQGQIAGHSATVDLLYEWIAGLSEAEHKAMEYDARFLAAAILMPAEEFSKIFTEAMAKHQQQMGSAKDRQSSLRFCIRRLYQTYGVSFDAACVRARCLRLIKPHDLVLLQRYSSRFRE